MNEFISELKIYIKYIKINYNSALQYKGWFLSFLKSLFFVITNPLNLVLLFSRFGGIGEWTVERIILVYAIAITSYGFAELFFRGFDMFPSRMVKSGDFDRLLLRPCSLYVQVAGSFFSYFKIIKNSWRRLCDNLGIS